MAPLKLPAVKSKAKGKAKQLHIDYATLDSARASAPADWSAEAWLEEGTRQEEQGERYQVGPKAARHLWNALTCYRLAATTREFAFDARYNAARVSHALGADHLNPPECLEALQAARNGYRQALAIAPPEEATARIDALYNLAQADATLLAQLQAGIVAPTPDRTETEKELAREAKELFSEVERLQRVELDRYQNKGDDTVDLSSDGPDQLEVEGGDGAVETSVQVTAIVTPRLVIDTVLASISFDMQLSESSLADPETDSQLRQSAVDAFSRAMELRAVVAAQEGEHEIADLDFELAVHEIEIMTTWSSAAAAAADVGPRLDQLVATTAEGGPLPSRQIDALSLLADYLVDEAFPPKTSPTPDESNSLTTTATLERALTAYQRAASLLSNRLSPPKHIPALQLPSLLSANLASQAQVHLIAHLVGLSSSGVSFSHLDEAQRLSIEAIAAAKPTVVLSVPSFSSSSSTAANTASPSSLPPVSAIRPPGANDARTDWTTLAAVRTGFFTLLRVRYYYACATAESPSSLLLRDQLKARAWGEWSALGLAKGRDGGGGARNGDGLAALKRSEVSWWLNEIDEDAVAKVVGAEVTQAERAWWASLAP
ncbi:hypothetical protein C6P46_001787 [Rhodotorula mucilaginosa]|jgi:hypothetical protein|uniref:Uncharacterized protein n=1 Tax=Rhodotorula mucilaginosa TaxID=5537 RepID=A0A9P6VTE0_RHOMI|nr:hypothetical protein C6P46_001787 [Rhodotorula mucilaginosa]TKA52177.1 hypothetical protein B0A53_05021 [Rhodotorula sp. CCFEE 5036]